MMKPKCAKCKADLQLVASGYMRYQIRPDGTQGYMFMGQPDGREEFLICGHVKCNARYAVQRLENGKILRGKYIE